MRNQSPPRAIGIVRVSEQGDRKDESFYSPDIQRDAITKYCKVSGLDLLPFGKPEIDVSGGLPLDLRPGLGPAVQAIEDGKAEALVIAYQDRLDRSLKTRGEVIERVEACGGLVVTATGEVLSYATADKWAQATLGGFMGEYQRRIIREKSAEGQRRAVEAGHWIGPVPPGYVKGEDGRLAVDPETEAITIEAFELRADGESYSDIRDYLAEHGIERTVSGVRAMLRSRAYLGQIHFGPLVNLQAHPAIIERDLFAKVQRTRSSAGRKAKSDRLLARLDVLRCGVCGGRMSASRNTHGYLYYRCTSQACEQPMTIGAELVERLVVEQVKAAVADDEGRASMAESHRATVSALEQAQEELASAARVLSVVDDEAAAQERLLELKASRDAWQERVDQLGSDRATIVIDAVGGWDRLSLDERRAVIRATLEAVIVDPGRGADRVAFQFVS